MNEHSFVKAVHRKLPSDVYRWKIHDTFTGGVPDAMYAGPAGLVFAEYKYLKTLPKKPTTLIKNGLTPLQIQWLERMSLYNVLVLAIIGSPLGGVVLTDNFGANLTLHDFDHAMLIKDVARVIYELTHDNEERIRLSRPRPKLATHLEQVQRRTQNHTS